MPDNRLRIIIDTNVFVAAYWAPNSASARLIRYCLIGNVQAVYTQDIKREVMYILKRIKVKPEYLARVELFWKNAVLVEPVAVEPVVVEDADDQKYLEASAGGDVDYLVTNDEHLLCIGYINRTEILTPSSIQKIIGSTGQ